MALFIGLLGGIRLEIEGAQKYGFSFCCYVSKDLGQFGSENAAITHYET